MWRYMRSAINLAVFTVWEKAVVSKHSYTKGEENSLFLYVYMVITKEKNPSSLHFKENEDMIYKSNEASVVW